MLRYIHLAEVARRIPHPIAALAVGTLLPGTGHLCSGRIRRAFIVFVVWSMCWLCHLTPWWLFVALVSAADAAWVACRTRHNAARARDAAALDWTVERLVSTLPRPELAALRLVTTRLRIPPGSLAVLPLEPAEAASFSPGYRHCLALRLPNGRWVRVTGTQISALDEPLDPDAEAVLLGASCSASG